MLKKVLSIILAGILLLTLTSCSTELSETAKTSGNEVTVSQTTSVTSDQQKKEEIEDAEDTTAADSEIVTENSDTTSQTDDTVPETTEKKEPVKTESKPPQTATTQTEKPKPNTEKATTTTTSKETADDEVAEEKPIETDQTNPQSVPLPSTTEIEQKVAEYINQYRVAQGNTSAVVLPGLTKVARYRANQLITNFAHINGRSVCAELKYGRYVDLTEYGLPESDNYYEGYDREAICKGDWSGTADQIAKRIAEGFKNSSKHWEYVGASEYGYLAVGITYNSANKTWYGCICMSMENYGG